MTPYDTEGTSYNVGIIVVTCPAQIKISTMSWECK